MCPLIIPEKRVVRAIFNGLGSPYIKLTCIIFSYTLHYLLYMFSFEREEVHQHNKVAVKQSNIKGIAAGEKHKAEIFTETLQNWKCNKTAI